MRFVFSAVVVAALCATAGQGSPPFPSQSTLITSLAHRQVTGAAGPYARVTVTLRRNRNELSGPFTGRVDIPGRRSITLAGPDEPGEFFMLDPKAVTFTPVDRSGRNGIIVLYDSSQIGPGHGTQHRALVFRVESDTAQRIPAVERRLEGAASAAEVRRRLKRGKQ